MRPIQKPMQNAQERQQQTQQRLEAVFNTSYHSDMNNFATYLAYNGLDATRKLKTEVNIAREEDKKQTELMYNKVKKLVSDSDYIEYEEYYEEESSKGVLWYAWKVNFLKDAKRLKTKYFGFIKINNKFYLGAVD